MHERGVALLLLVRHTIHECLQRWCPLGSVQPAGGMAQLALELKECCVDSSGLSLSHDCRRDGRREKFIGRAQDVEQLGLHPGEVFLRVETHRCPVYDHQRVGVKLFRPHLGAALDLGFAGRDVRKLVLELLVDAIPLQGLHAYTRHHLHDTAAVVIPTTVPVGVGGEPLDEVLDRIGCRSHARRRDRDHDAIHEIRIGYAPLKSGKSAVRRTGDCHEVLHTQMLEECPLHVDDIHEGEIREVGTVGLARRRVEAGRGCRTIGRAEVVRRHHKPAVGVDRFAGADKSIPRSGRGIFCRIATGRMEVAGGSMRDQYGVAAIWCERAVGFIRDRERGQELSILQLEVARGE